SETRAPGIGPALPNPARSVQLDPDSDLILALFLLDLEALRPQLPAFSHPKPRGALPRDPIQRFRSLLCRILSGQPLRFTQWVATLRSRPLLAALSGFADCTPGIATCYAFTARLFPETTDSIIRQAIFNPNDSAQDRPPRPGLARASGHNSSQASRPPTAGF